MLMRASECRHALIVGINRYKYFPASMQLTGCVNDAQLIAAVLGQKFGFPPHNITTLTDEEATRDGLLRAMEALRGRVREGSAVVVHYSGHGSRRPTRLGNKPDGKDQTIVPYDSGRRPHENLDIDDNYFYDWILDLSTVTRAITLIFDSCYAGSITRDSFGAPVRQAPEDDRPPQAMSSLSTSRGQGRGVGPSGWLPLDERYVLVAGCRHDQQSCELLPSKVGAVPSEPQGALTFFFCQELLRAGPDATYRDVFERTCLKVKALFPSQHPQLEGAGDRVLFGVRERTPMPFLPVLERDRDHLLLGGGAAHGLTPESEWAIYPPGTLQPDGSTRLGSVQVEEVRAVTARALLQKSPKAAEIQAGSRAFVQAFHYGEMRLVVDLCGDGEEIRQLRRRVAGSDLLRFPNQGEKGELKVYLLPRREDAQEEDPLPQLGALTKPLWAVVGLDGQLALPTTDEGPGAVSTVTLNLEAMSRYRQVLTLENRDPESDFRDRLEASLLRRRGAGEAEAVQPDASGEIVFNEGESLVIVITNHHESPVYLTVLDFGLTGRVAVLYPIGGSQEPLESGRQLQIGIRKGDELDLEMPEKFPFSPAEEGGIVEGTEYLKILATSHEADFRVLQQAGFRGRRTYGPRDVGGPLQELLTMAWLGQGSRSSTPVQHQKEDTWMTLTKSFTLRKREASTGGEDR